MQLSAGTESLDSLRAEWPALLADQRARKVFRHPRWQALWLEQFGAGREPLYVAVREGRALVGLATLLRDGDKISFLGDTNICDYMDFLFLPGREREVVAAILDWLKGEDWQEVEFWGLHADSQTPSLLTSLAAERGLQATLEPEAVCPQLDLPANWEEYLSSLSKKNRHELRRKMRRMAAEAGEPRLEALRAPAAVEAGMGEFLRLMTLNSEKAEFMTPEMDRFFRRMAAAMAEEGLVALYRYEVEGKLVAATFAFEDEEELLLYNSGFDPAYSYLSVGLLSKAACLHSAIESGKRRFDFLRGSEPYKYDLGGQDLAVCRCLVKRE